MKGLKTLRDVFAPHENTHPGQFRGVRRHGCERRLVGLRDIHDEETGWKGQYKGLDHQKKSKKGKKKQMKTVIKISC